MWQQKMGDWITAFAGDMWGLYGANQSENFAHGQNQKNRDMQYDFAQHGIQWRVEDAKAAGLHPLFALGAQIQGASPSQMVGDVGGVGQGSRAAAGQDSSQAFARSSPEAREMLATQLQVQRSLGAKYDAEANLAHSQAMRNYQDPSSGLLPGGGATGGGDTASGVVVPERNQFNPENQGAVNMQGAKRNSSAMFDRGVEAGVAPGVMELGIPGTSLKMAIPATDDIGETLSEMDNPLAAAALIVLNRKMYGPYWLSDMIREVVMDQPRRSLDQEHKPEDYTLHQVMEVIDVLKNTVSRGRMPAAKKEFSGAGQPWWVKSELFRKQNGLPYSIRR